MFEYEIQQTPFTTTAADQYFSEKINGDSYGSDNTMLSTLRALLYGRIGDSAMHYHFTSIANNSIKIETRTPESWGASFRSLFDYCTDYLHVALLSSSDTTGNAKMYDILAEHFAAPGSGWVRLKPITDFFRRNFDVLCFIKPEERQTVYFLKQAGTAQTSMRIYHQLQMSLLTAMPWYFNPQNGDRLSPEEKELLESLQQKDHTRYLECLKKIERNLNFEEMFIREQLTQIETVYERRRIDEVKYAIEEILRNITTYENTINSLLESLTERNVELAGLQDKLAAGPVSSVLCDYFLHNRSLRLGTVSDTHLRYHVNTYMTYFDGDAAFALIQNKRSVIYTQSSMYPAEHIAKLMKALFVDETIRLRFCSAYDLNVAGGVSGIKSYDYKEDSLDRMPNPHIRYHACLGNHRQALDAAMKKRDYIGAIEQTVASASSMNVLDTLVMEEFCRDLFRNRTSRWFEAPDGTKMNLIEALDYVTKEETEETHE